MSLDNLHKHNQEKKALQKKIYSLESKNRKFMEKLNDMMPYYLRERIAGYHREEIQLEDMHEYLTEKDLKNLHIETYFGQTSAYHTGSEDEIRKSVTESVREKDFVSFGLLNHECFSIYREDDYVRIFHRGLHFHTDSSDEYCNNHVELLDYKPGAKHVDVLVKVLWCNEFIHHYFRVNVKRFNEFYEKNKNKKSFLEIEIDNSTFKKTAEQLISENVREIVPEPVVEPKKSTYPDWLILGKRYRVKSREWFNANKDANGRVVQDGVTLNNWFECGKTLTVTSLEERSDRKGKVQMKDLASDNYHIEYWIPLFALEPDPSDNRILSHEIVELADNIRSHKYIYSASNATGAGRGTLREMKDVEIIAGFNHKGEECLLIPDANSWGGIMWNTTDVRKLVSSKKTERSQKITEHSGVNYEVVIGNDRNTMPKDFQWDSFH